MCILIVLLCAYHFHGRMSQWQIFVTLWLTIAYSELNCVCLFIIAEHLLHVLVYFASVLLILTYRWLGSCTMFKWYLGLNFLESPSFDCRESNQVDVRVMCLCTWIFAVCLFFYRCLADLPKEKRLYMMFHHPLLLNKLVSHLSRLKTQIVRGLKLLSIHRLTQAFLKMLLP